MTDIAPELKRADYPDDPNEPMRTAELFRACLGRELTIRDFDQYGNLELRPCDEHADLRREFGRWHTIWQEPEYAVLVQRKIAGKKK